MSTYFDKNGNVTTEKPRTADDWEYHFSYKKALAKSSDAEKERVKNQVLKFVADAQRARAEKKARLAYIRAGGDPARWDSVKGGVLDQIATEAAAAGAKASNKPVRYIKF